MITNRLDEFHDDLWQHDISEKRTPHYAADWREWIAEALDGHIVYGQTYNVCDWNVREANRVISKQREVEREWEEAEKKRRRDEQCSI